MGFSVNLGLLFNTFAFYFLSSLGNIQTLCIKDHRQWTPMEVKWAGFHQTVCLAEIQGEEGIFFIPELCDSSQMCVWIDLDRNPIKIPRVSNKGVLQSKEDGLQKAMILHIDREWVLEDKGCLVVSDQNLRNLLPWMSRSPCSQLLLILRGILTLT